MSRRLARGLAVTALAVAALAGCDDDGSYVAAPPAYGDAGHCYYVDSPAEAIALQQAGLCPVTWTPMLMPAPWHARYAWWYDSPRYYDHYVPAASRPVYVTHVRVYEKKTRGIVTKAPKATRTTAPAGNSAVRDSTSRQGLSTGSRPRATVGTPARASRSTSTLRTGNRR